MVVRSPLRAAGCAACRASILRSFLSTPAPFVTVRASTRSLHPLTKTWPRFASSSNTTVAKDELPSNSAAEEQASPEASQTTDEIPWYLQEEAPRHPTLVHEPAPLPDVPEGSPALLEPLLKFASDELGLDDLHLMDLRSLDPPPALGANLLMLFSTARSERHLHVSAGGLVRWLRKRGITADADGLLGPNELKIKLRRKARKAKLLGHSGAAPGGDDGISTRWICVNLGTLGYSAEEKEVESGDGRFSGFGTPRLGTTVVVQIFTDAKRKELDLETLWSRISKRSKNAQIVDDLEYPDLGPEDPFTSMTTASNKDLSSLSQRRLFSTSARQLASVDTSRGPFTDQVTQTFSGGADISRVNEPAAHGVDEESTVLNGLEPYLSGLPREQAVQELEALRTTENHSISDFMSSWRLAVEALPSVESWHHRLSLHVFAQRLGARGFTFPVLFDLVKEMQLSGIQATREQYITTLQAIYYNPSGDAALEEQSKLALRLLGTLYARGEAVIAHDVIVGMLEALIRSGVRDEETMKLRSAIENLMVEAQLPYMGEALLLRLMHAYASEGNWDKFWDTWRIPPRFRAARSAEAYLYIYTLMARSRHQSRCIDTVRWCFQEMLNEEPPVRPEGEVLAALRECIRVADPHAEQIAMTNVVKDEESQNIANREFVKLTRLLNHY